MYGVPAFSVSRRTQELGIRLALGAPARSLVRMVVREGLAPVAAGLALGLFGALAAGRLIQGLLFDVAPADPWALGGVMVLLVAVASVACYIPARRITRIDPVQALRFGVSRIPSQLLTWSRAIPASPAPSAPAVGSLTRWLSPWC